MPRFVLLGSIIISIVSLALAQTSTPTNSSGRAGTIAAAEGQSTDKNLPAKVAVVNADVPGSESTANARVVSPKPKPGKPISSTRAEKNDLFEFDRRPRLIIFPQLNLNNSGFAPVSEAITGGVGIESRHLILQARARYDNAHKDNDGTEDNRKGRVRELSSDVYYRLPNYWFFGTSGGWYQLSTTNYSVQSWGMGFGGGTDFIRNEASFRLSGTYTPPYFDHRNGSQGFSVEFVDPSPLAQKHIMFVVSSSIGWFHTTITDPTDPGLTALQKSQKHISGSAQYGILFRF
ncbi:MAG: hypothetical protein LAO30_21490 [Acidobacteriia bacterium]|nr:hypothetical protein [Terriglobia bacterium]